jgi:hypothetical protein
MRIFLTLLFSLIAVVASAQPSVDARTVFLGATGSTCAIRSGAGVPGTGLGAVCDTYIRKDSPYTIYVKTGASTWSEIYRQSGTDVAVADGGTGLSSYTTGDLLYASGATTLAGRAAVATGQVLTSAGTSTAPVWSASPSLTSIGGAANLTINPTGDVVFNPTGNDILPTTGYDLNIGSLTAKYLTLHAAELWVETLVAQNTIATIGGRILVGPTTTLTVDLAAAGTTITVKHNQIANGDRLYMEADGKVEFMAVTSGAGGGAGAYTYTVTRNLDGTGANDWFAGDAVFNTGTTNDGYIDLYSISGVNAGSTVGPTIVGNVRTGTTYSNLAPRWAIGNLNGLYGYGADTYGAAFGDSTNSYLTIDATNGIRMIGDAGTMFSMTAAGDATFAGKLTVGTGRNMLSNSEFIRGRAAGDSYRGFWGGSSATLSVDPSAPYVCTAPCTQRATHGTGWSWSGVDEDTSATTVTLGADTAVANKPLGGGAIYWYPTTGTPANGTLSRLAGPVLPVDEDLKYEFSAYVAMLSGTWSINTQALWYGEDGVDAGDQPDFISATGGSICSSGVQSQDIGTWCRTGSILTPPSGARLVQLAIVATYDGGDVTPISFFTRPYFGEAGTAQTTLTPWGPGGQTLITGDMLSTDMVVANTLRSAGATALATGTGYWLDATGTPTFRVGDPSGNQLKWDGTNLTIGQGTLNIDSTGITLTSGNSQTWTAGSAFRFSGASSDVGTFGWAYTDGSSNVYRGIELTASNTANGSALDKSEVKMTARVNDGSTRLSYISVSTSSTSGPTTTGSITLQPYNDGIVDLNGYLNLSVGGDATAVGGAATLPANPCGFITIRYAGNAYLIPAYHDTACP